MNMIHITANSAERSPSTLYHSRIPHVRSANNYLRTAILTVLFVFMLFTGAVFADDGFSGNPRVVDNADLLSSEEETSLENDLDEISERQLMDVIVITVTDIGDSASVVSYADDYYDNNGYGYGDNKDGLLLLISMEERDWYITTSGLAINYFTDAGIEYIGEQITPDLSDGAYATAFTTYANLCDEFITQGKTGEPYDVGNLPQEPLSVAWIFAAIAIGLILSFSIVGSMKGQLHSVRYQPAASSYIRPGSLHITTQSDLFLYHTVNRVRKQKQSSGGGGSSTHTSSGGHSHGGGGGKF